jgi:hypothetical protein
MGKLPVLKSIYGSLFQLAAAILLHNQNYSLYKNMHTYSQPYEQNSIKKLHLRDATVKMKNTLHNCLFVDRRACAVTRYTRRVFMCVCMAFVSRVLRRLSLEVLLVTPRVAHFGDEIGGAVAANVA